jgi:serine/threonine-protein kinase SRPK3
LLIVPTKEIIEIMESYVPKTGVPLVERTDLENLSKNQKKKLKQRLQKLEEEKLKAAETSTEPTTVDVKMEEVKTEENEEKKIEEEEIEEEPKIEVKQSTYKYTPPPDGQYVKLADFGNACWTFKQFSDEIQTRQYRSPEVILGQKYSTPVDMWSFACFIFELATGDYLFDPQNSSKYSRDEDHLALMIECLGPLPTEMYKGRNFNKFLSSKGEPRNIRNLKPWNLFDRLVDEYKFSESDALEFSSFLLPMLEFTPSKRATASSSLTHSWLELAAQDYISQRISDFCFLLNSVNVKKLENLETFEIALNELEKVIEMKKEELKKLEK